MGTLYPFVLRGIGTLSAENEKGSRGQTSGIQAGELMDVIFVLVDTCPNFHTWNSANKSADTPEYEWDWLVSVCGGGGVAARKTHFSCAAPMVCTAGVHFVSRPGWTLEPGHRLMVTSDVLSDASFSLFWGPIRLTLKTHPQLSFFTSTVMRCSVLLR